MKYPFIVPNPPRLSELGAELTKLESSGCYSNYGPLNTLFEKRAIEELFQGQGHCTTIANATLGLILAVRQQLDRYGNSRAKYAILPSFTFAATAQAAVWNQLAPLYCDIDSKTWLPCPESEERILQKFPGEIGVLIACTTFGNPIDLDWYRFLSKKYQVPIVVDAAAALGVQTEDHAQFGIEFEFPIVYSMHVTKAFSTSEGGLIYCADEEMISSIRRMANFGFGSGRAASVLGMNAKLSEVAALLCLKKLDEFPKVVEHRCKLVESYKRLLPLQFQKTESAKLPYSFLPVFREGGEDARDFFIKEAADCGVQVQKYFSPTLHKQSYFQKLGSYLDLRNTEKIENGILSLPVHDSMSESSVPEICAILCDKLEPRKAA